MDKSKKQSKKTDAYGALVRLVGDFLSPSSLGKAKMFYSELKELGIAGKVFTDAEAKVLRVLFKNEFIRGDLNYLSFENKATEGLLGAVRWGPNTKLYAKVIVSRDALKKLRSRVSLARQYEGLSLAHLPCDLEKINSFIKKGLTLETIPEEHSALLELGLTDDEADTVHAFLRKYRLGSNTQLEDSGQLRLI